MTCLNHLSNRMSLKSLAGHPHAWQVEGVMHDFVRLSEEFLLGMEALEGNLCDMGDGSDDEVYQV